jgi:hypothetical protein
MADNFNFTPGTGKTGAADDIGGVLYPRVKIAQGADGTATDVSSAAPLQVSLANHGANATPVKVDGSAVTQPVSAASLPLPTGAATEATLATRLTESDFDAKIGSLTEAAPASDTASSGLNGRLQRISQRITSLIASTLATSAADGSNVTLGAKADAKSTATDTTSITIMSVLKQISASVQAAASSLAGTLTVASHAVTNAGTFAVQATEADGANTTLGAKADAKSTASDTTAITIMSVLKQISFSIQAAAASLAGSLTVATHAVTQSGTWTVQPGNTANTTAWKVDGSAVTQPVSIGSVPSHPVTNAGTFATQENGAALTSLQLMDDTVFTDDAAFTPATSKVSAVGFMADSTSTDSVDEGDIGAARMTLDRRQITQPYEDLANAVSGAITSAMTGTTSTSLVAAPGANLRNYITTIIVSNAHATVGTDVIIQDGSGGTTLLTIPAAAVYGGAVITLPMPLRQPTANTALFCANVTTGASTKVSAVGFKAA